MLDLRDKMAIARAMLALMPALPQDNGENFQQWLEHHGQTKQAIDRFWAPVLVSALNEELDRTSVRYAALVFRDSFLKSAEAGRMGVPAVPLSQLYGPAAQYIEERGGKVHTCARRSIRFAWTAIASVCASVARNSPSTTPSLAAPFNTLDKLLPDAPELDSLRRRCAAF